MESDMELMGFLVFMGVFAVITVVVWERFLQDRYLAWRKKKKK
jgi:hypothetical protein